MKSICNVYRRETENDTTQNSAVAVEKVIDIDNLETEMVSLSSSESSSDKSVLLIEISDEAECSDNSVLLIEISDEAECSDNSVQAIVISDEAECSDSSPLTQTLTAVKMLI